MLQHSLYGSYFITQLTNVKQFISNYFTV